MPTSPPSEIPSSLPVPAPTPMPTASPTLTAAPTRPGPCFDYIKTETDLLLSSSTVDVTFDLSTDATYDDAFRGSADANLTVALSGDFNNGTEDGVREEAFLAVNGNSVTTDGCTCLPRLDSSGGQAFGFRSAGYETCAPFLDVPVPVQDGVLAATISASASVDGCPAFARATFMRATAASRPHRCRRRGRVPHRPTRRRKCHPQGRRHYPRCHQQKRRRARHPHNPRQYPFRRRRPRPRRRRRRRRASLPQRLHRPDAAAHGKLRADASADHNTLVIALSGALSSTIDELRPDNRRPAIIKTDADADADPVAVDGRADGGLPDGVPARRRRHE